MIAESERSTFSLSLMDTMFKGKRALVTGGGRGIGRVIAQLLHRHGAKTFVVDMSVSDLESFKQDNPDIEVIEADITVWGHIGKVVQDILPIDLLVNNAGLGRDRAFLDYVQSDIDKVFEVNYKAAFVISQIIARDLIERNRFGSIVNISSAISMRHLPNKSIYGPSKAALDSLTRYMAQELGPRKIRVNSVNPFGIPTVMLSNEIPERVIQAIPLKRLGGIQEVADAVVFLLSDKASFVDGVNMPVDGGHVL